MPKLSFLPTLLFFALIFFFSTSTFAQVEEPDTTHVPLDKVPQNITEEPESFGLMPDDEGPEPLVIEAPVEPDPNDLILVDKEPQPLNMDEVKKMVGYPDVARDAGIQGIVIVRILVDTAGNYVKHKVIAQGHPILRLSVEKHIPHLTFTPALKDGAPVLFWVNVPFRFKLLGGTSKKSKAEKKRLRKLQRNQNR